MTTTPPGEWPVIDRENPIEFPSIAVPADWDGSPAEAAALAVAGVIQGMTGELVESERTKGELLECLRRLATNYPRTSFAGSETAVEDAWALIARIDQAQGTEPKPGT